MMHSQEKKALIGMSLAQLEAELCGLGCERFRAKQLWHWMYVMGVSKFDEMSNLPSTLRALLEERYTLQRAAISKELISFDGTRKWLLRFDDGNEIETVYIPTATRGTLCVSSQVGCILTCKFCHTGTQKLVRNLTAGEILAQVMLAKDALQDWPSDAEGRKLTNIVMMGMGEPLYNYENVAEAIKIITSVGAIGLSKHNITLSTSGVVPQMELCGLELGVNLAVSLHAVTDELRNHLVPINKKYPISQLIGACRRYAEIKKRGRITFEYVMLHGVNDSVEDARKLARLIVGIPAKINLIPFNPWPGAEFECSTPQAMDKFADILQRAGYVATVRTPRGQDILAACGQLKSESERVRKPA